MIVVFALSMLFLTCGMLWYGIKLQRKLNSGVITNPVEKAKKVAIVYRINGVLAICNICFFLRVVSLVGLASGIIWDTDYTSVVGTFGWFVFSMWVPTLVPVSIVAYILLVAMVLT